MLIFSFLQHNQCATTPFLFVSLFVSYVKVLLAKLDTLILQGPSCIDQP